MELGILNSTFHDTNFRESDIRHLLVINTNTGAADFTNASILRLLKNWGEVTEEDLNYVIQSMGQVALSGAFQSFTKATMGKIRELNEQKLAQIYDVGRKAAVSSFSASYAPTQHSEKISGNSTYMEVKEYGKPKEKGKKDTTLRYK